jgi:hypothetical protein
MFRARSKRLSVNARGIWSKLLTAAEERDILLLLRNGQVNRRECAIGAGRFDLSSAGKPPEKSSVVVVAQSAFFWLSKHGCELFLLRVTVPLSDLSRPDAVTRRQRAT